MQAFLKKTTAFIHQEHLWTEGVSLAVAVSGGADSRVLLDVLVRLQKKYALKLHIVHVNYRLRGKDSLSDERLVRELAAQYDLPLSVMRPRYKHMRGNEENLLRDIRYRFFETIRRRYHLDAIAVAHTLDDQAETLLLHLFRGAGLQGLRGILPRRDGIVRPLLWATHAEILEYCHTQQLVFHEDSSNTDTRFTRNRIRHELLPYLTEHFSPAIKQILARNAQTLAQQYAELEQMALTTSPAQSSEIVIEAFLKQSVAVQRQRVRRYAQQLGQTLSSKQLDEVLRLLSSTKSKTASKSIGGLKILRKGDKLSLTSSL